jgi:hypothetical protein
MSAMEAQSPSMPAALTPDDISDHFAELAAALDNDPFEIYAELATTAAAFPAEHHAAMADALAMSDSEVSIALLEQRVADASRLMLRVTFLPLLACCRSLKCSGWGRSTRKAFHPPRWWRR